MTPLLVVQPGPFAWTLGRIADGRLAEVRVVERIDGVEEGLFRARLTRLVPELGGAFVDVGGPEVLARLPAALRRSRPAEGTWLLVQGTRDATFDKPARATATWRVSGRRLDLRGQPGQPAVDEALQGSQRRRLQTRALALFPDCPVTLRGPADGATDSELLAEANALAALREGWRARAERLTEPGPVVTFDERLLAVRHALGVDDDAAVMTATWARLEVVRRLGVPTDAVRAADEPWAVAGVAEAWAAAHEVEVPFGQGARLFVEPTRAVVAVDVDRGASTTKAATLDVEAARVLAEAIAVRQLGGQMVVDFLEPGGSTERAALESAIRTTVEPTGTRLVALFGSGLAVLERPRRTAALHERRAPLRDGATALLEAIADSPLAGFRIAPDLCAFLERPRVAALAAEWLRVRAAVPRLVRDPDIPPTTFVRS